MQLVDRERGETGEAANPADVRLDRSPAGRVRLRDSVDDCGEAGGRQRCTCEVEATPTRLLAVGRDDLPRGDEKRRGDGEVDVEDCPPVGELGENAADEDADRRARSADCAPSCERLRASCSVECGRDDRECCRGEERGTESLTRASREQRSGASGHRRGERGSGEDGEAGEEHAAASEEIGRATAEQQETSEDERVARDRPADVRAAQVEVGGNVRQGDVHGGDVEDDHELGDEQHREEPAGGPRAGVFRVARRVVGVLGLVVMHDLTPPKLDCTVRDNKSDNSVQCQGKGAIS